MKSAGEIFLSGLRGAKTFSNTFRIVFRIFFRVFQTVFRIDFKVFRGQFRSADMPPSEDPLFPHFPRFRLEWSELQIQNIRPTGLLLTSPRRSGVFSRSGWRTEGLGARKSSGLFPAPFFLCLRRAERGPA